MKKSFAVLAVTLCVAFTGCSGVPQEQYDALVAEKAELIKQVDDINANYNELIDTNAELESELDGVQSQLSSANKTIEQIESSLNSDTDSKEDQYKNKIRIVAEFLTYNYDCVETGRITDSISYICRNTNYENDNVSCVSLCINDEKPLSECAKLFVSCSLKIQENYQKIFIDNKCKSVLCIVNYGDDCKGVVYADVIISPRDTETSSKDYDVYVDIDITPFDDIIKDEIKGMYNTDGHLYDIPFIANSKMNSEVSEAKGYETGITYTEISRSPDLYKGKKVKFTGSVLQIIEGYAYNEGRMSTSGNYDDVVYIKYDTDLLDFRLLEDDKITIYGVFDGLHSYTTIMGATVTLPIITIDRIELTY